MAFFKKLFGGAEKEELVVEVASEVVELKDELVLSPLSGGVVPLSDVNDPVFASGAMGQGVAIKPSQGVVYAPADAEVTIAFETGHAYGLKTVDGAEILIHVGIDTVSMNGDGFDQKVVQGSQVKAGDVLGTFDAEKIAAAGLESTTMIIITNSTEYSSVSTVAGEFVEQGQALLDLKL